MIQFSCPVCGKKLNNNMICPACGFDESLNAEHYPALAPVPGAESVAAKQARQHEEKVMAPLREKLERLEKSTAALTAESVDLRKMIVKLEDESKTLKESNQKLQQKTAKLESDNKALLERLAALEKNQASPSVTAPTPLPAPGTASGVKKDSLDNTPPGKIAVGSVITLGKYPQTAEGEECPIYWHVLDIKDGNALVISKYALDCRPYHISSKAITWDICTLRIWLTSSFFMRAFSDAEREKIALVPVPADQNPKFKAFSGSNVNDKIFLLSVPEVEKYMPTVKSRITIPTEYAKKQGCFYNSETNSSWPWLRTPGSEAKRAAGINSNGSINYNGSTVTANDACIRPAMWIKLKG